MGGRASFVQEILDGLNRNDDVFYTASSDFVDASSNTLIRTDPFFRIATELLGPLGPSNAPVLASHKCLGCKKNNIRLDHDLGLGPVPLLDMYELLPGKVQTRYAFRPTTYGRVRDMCKFVQKVDFLAAKVELILEPLKCRVITKGQSLPYHMSQTFQKHAWKTLRKIPAMALIGEPLDASHLTWVFNQTRHIGMVDFDYWVSGDYKAATDNLSLDINRCALTSLLDAFQATDLEREVCLKVLGPHRVHYPDRLSTPEEPLDPIVMTNGQLMGSPLSFPVLCAINLVAYWAALEEYTGTTFKRDQLPVLINGDDICFMANEEFYAVWKKWIKKVGFDLSLGKNYISKYFVTMNSQGYAVQHTNHFTRIGALNVGLLLGESAKVGARSGTESMPIDGKISELLSSANDPSRAFGRFLHYNPKSVAAITDSGRYNLFAPRELGGIGVPPPPGYVPRFTAFQQLLAGASHSHWKSLKGNSVREIPSCPFQRVSVNTSTDRRLSAPTKRFELSELAIRHMYEPDHFDDENIDERATRVAPTLLNFQLRGVCLQKEYEVRSLNSRRIRSVFAAETKIRNPTFFDLRFVKKRGAN